MPITSTGQQRRERLLPETAQRADHRLQVPLEPLRHRLACRCGRSGSASPPTTRPPVEDHAPNAIALDQVQVVARHEHRDADLVEPPEQVHDLDREIGVEVSGRLVRDQDRRLADDGARDTDALLLSGRELDRAARLAAEQSDLVERCSHALADVLFRHAGDHERQRDVVIDRTVHQQLVILEHDADLATERRDLRTLERARVLSIHNECAAARTLDQRDQLEQRALAGP
jgi:hypothetical protein